MKCIYCGYDNISISKCENNKCLQCAAPFVCSNKNIKLNASAKLGLSKNSIII